VYLPDGTYRARISSELTLRDKGKELVYFKKNGDWKSLKASYLRASVHRTGRRLSLKANVLLFTKTKATSIEKVEGIKNSSLLGEGYIKAS